MKIRKILRQKENMKKGPKTNKTKILNQKENMKKINMRKLLKYKRKIARRCKKRTKIV